MRCGRKETRNKYSEAQRRAWERHAAGNGGRGPHRGLELELDGSPARKIHIFKYFSHGPQSPRHAALPPTYCLLYPLRTYYLPGTCLGIAAGTPRVSGFLVTRCRFLSLYFPRPSFPCNYPLYYGAQHASSLFVGRRVRVFRVYRCIARPHVHGRAFAGRNASTTPGNVTAATVSTAVAMSSLMADVEDGDSTFRRFSDAFPNHYEYLKKRKIHCKSTQKLNIPSSF